jgi:hypothetical protein
VPSTVELAALPASVQVAAVEFLAAFAPDLDPDLLRRTLRRRANDLNDLWEEWGRVRPLLLEEVVTAI